jgi:hypothetical protein
MARRRVHAIAPVAGLQPPAEFLRCRTGQWVTDVETAEIRAKCQKDRATGMLRGSGNAEDDARWAITWTAYRRWADFRRDWLDDHDIDRVDECRVWPLSRPEY